MEDSQERRTAAVRVDVVRGKMWRCLKNLWLRMEEAISPMLVWNKQAISTLSNLPIIC